mmetsp:Transcript_25719/g.66523  ORF Transcript_25719/g.66523 Transcript_25719/m.66523 type:complete len:133 (+) Transcript_25719:134-532(+)
MSGQFTFYNNFIKDCKPGNSEENVTIYDAMVKCANLGDQCYGITLNTGCDTTSNPAQNCYTSAIPDPSQLAEKVYFCNSGQLQWAGQLDQSWVSAIKWTGRDVFNGDLPPDPGVVSSPEDGDHERHQHHHRH